MSSNGISHRAQNWSSPEAPIPPPGRPLQGGLQQAGVQHVAYPQDQDAQDQQAPALLSTTEGRVADEGEQVDATPKPMLASTASTTPR